MRIIAYSDISYVKIVQNLVHSLEIFSPIDNLTFYSVNFFDPTCLISERIKIDHKNFVPRYKVPSLNFIKPSIMLKSLSDYPGEDLVFIDSDVTVGKRFLSFDFQRKMNDFPLSPFGPFEHPYTYRVFEDGTREDYYPDRMMEYFNVDSRSCRYVQNCLIIYGSENRDFIKEWESICLNEFLLEKHWSYFPFQDETAYNVLLWKYGASNNLGHCFVNTHKFSTYKMVEETDIFDTNIDDNPYEYCNDSNKTIFYHGTKDINQNLIIQRYNNENSSSNPRFNTNPS